MQYMYLKFLETKHQLKEGNDMSTPFSGGCVCGAVRYECAAEPIATINCHCRDCQKTSGSQMSTNVLVSKSGFKLQKGTPKFYSFTADSGNMVERQFCGNCGTPLFMELKAMPDVWVLKASSLDDPSWLKPAMHIYCDSAQPWDPIQNLPADSDLPRHGKMPPM